MARPKKDSAEYYVSMIKKIIEGKKGEDIVTIDMKGFSFTDYFIIASGDSVIQLNAIADEIVIKLDYVLGGGDPNHKIFKIDLVDGFQKLEAIDAFLYAEHGK